MSAIKVKAIHSNGKIEIYESINKATRAMGCKSSYAINRAIKYKSKAFERTWQVIK
jgi:hypothetical protein